MSDPQVHGPETPVGDPVDDRPVVDDVVGSANAGLADAEAARESVPGDQRSLAHDEPVFSDAPAPVDPVADSEPAAATPATERYSAQNTSNETPAPAGDDVPWYDRPDAIADAANAEAAARADAAANANTVHSDNNAAAAGAVAAAPRETAYAPIAPAAMQPIFVQAPEAPRPRGNRAAAGAIGLLAAVVFAALYLGAWLGFGLIAGDITPENLGESALSALATWTLWVPTVVFFVAFWLLGGIINRGRWGHWVIFGLFVGVASYVGHILGELFQEPFWMLTAREGAALVDRELLAPLAIAAFVIGRELTIWFGAWVSSRGKRMTELNAESQREYERTLEAGPQLVQQ